MNKQKVISGLKKVAKGGAVVLLFALASVCENSFSISFNNTEQKAPRYNEHVRKNDNRHSVDDILESPFDVIYDAEDVKEAMDTIYQSTEEYLYDSSKKEAARDIFNLSQKTDSIKARLYAIKLLNRISEDLVYESGKVEISRLIGKII